MNPEAHIFTSNLEKFTEISLGWCAKEAEEATSTILQSIDILVEDTKRVSKVSEESLDAMRRLRGDMKLGDFSSPEEGVNARRNIAKIIQDLKELCHDHDEIRDMVGPIVQALQFQDRLRQNFENMTKMISVWLEHREKASRLGCFDEEAKAIFVSALYDCSTMDDERDKIEQVFPECKRPEAVADEALFF